MRYRAFKKWKSAVALKERREKRAEQKKRNKEYMIPRGLMQIKAERLIWKHDCLKYNREQIKQCPYYIGGNESSCTYCPIYTWLMKGGKK